MTFCSTFAAPAAAVLVALRSRRFETWKSTGILQNSFVDKNTWKEGEMKSALNHFNSCCKN